MQAKSEVIRRFIIDHVEEHPKAIAKLVAEHFAITRQAVNRHLKILIEDEILQANGQTKERSYGLKVNTAVFSLPIEANLSEDLIWHRHVGPLLASYKENVLNLCYHGFTEMFNNAIDHSNGTEVLVAVDFSVKSIQTTISDDGIGIFEKIKSRFGLADHREAILELAKGKLTTDATRHSGQGIFFTSRMFDRFEISSGHLFFTHELDDEDWLIESSTPNTVGTIVSMDLSVDTERTAREVFDRFTDREQDDYPFSKTHVPLSLARYDREQLVSRSQAKRVLARFERFEEVSLDFHGIDTIGQAFADEIFRVFHRNHPKIKLIVMNANPEVVKMIRRAQDPANAPSSPEDFVS